MKQYNPGARTGQIESKTFWTNTQYYTSILRKQSIINIIVAQWQVFRYTLGKLVSDRETTLDLNAAGVTEMALVQSGTLKRANLHSDHHHPNTQKLIFYRPDALPVAKPTASKH